MFGPVCVNTLQRKSMLVFGERLAFSEMDGHILMLHESSV